MNKWDPHAIGTDVYGNGIIHAVHSSLALSSLFTERHESPMNDYLRVIP